MSHNTKCVMPGCSNLPEHGKFLCKKHLSTGNDLRVPRGVVAIGFTKIYDALQELGDFSVPAVYEKLGLQEEGKAKDRIYDDLGKFLRTLRANNYIVKVGHNTGFVCYKIVHGEHWSKNVSVEISDEPTKQAPKQVRHITPAVTHTSSDLYALMQNMEREIGDLKIALKAVYKLVEEQQKAPMLCPIARLKLQQHPLIRGTVPEKTPTIIGDEMHAGEK